MAMEEKQLEMSSRSSTTSEVSRSKRSSIYQSLRKHPSVHNWLNPHEQLGLCKGCYTQLYESFPDVTWLTDHGSFQDVEKRSDDDTCTVCALIVQTVRQNKRMYNDLNKTHKVRIMHLSRLMFKMTTIAGGSFNELRVTVNNIEVCQLLVTHSKDARKSSWPKWPRRSKITDIGAGDLLAMEQANEIEDLEDLDDDLDLEHIDSMTIESVDDDSDIADSLPESITESIAEQMPETMSELVPEFVLEPALEPKPDPILEATPELVKSSRRKRWRQTYSKICSSRRSGTSDTASPPVIEKPRKAEDSETSKALSRVESQTVDSISDTDDTPQPSKTSRRKQQLKAFREKRWRTELKNSTPYTSNWFENIKDRQQLNFQSLRFWIENCQDRHKGETQSSQKDPIDIILIDVQDGCLTEADTSRRYLALSYQWGKIPKFDSLEVKKDNLDKLKEKGSLFRSNTMLQETFRDAITLVENIGERYLWIDRLCIKQDDLPHFEANVNHMDLIFGRSLATIVKMTGESASEQLPGVIPGSRPPLCSILHTQDHTVICRHPSLGTLANDCSYETRGWTFQERLLAPRCLIFTNIEVFFLCGAGSCRESCNGNTRLLELPHAAGMATSLTAKPGEPSKNPFEHFAQSWRNLDNEHLFVYSSGQICETRSDFDKVKSNLSSSFRERMLPTSFANHTLRALWSGFDKVVADKEMNEKYMLGYFVTYRHLLRDYSKRILTQKGDALRAWSWIATLLKRFSYGNEVSCGLPNAAMDLALLWTPVGDPLGSKKRRDERAEDGKEYYPTWSWTSMTDPVDLLVSQRWCAKGEGFVERLREIKDSKAAVPDGKPEPAVQSKFRVFLQQCSNLDLANRLGLSDQRPFESEVTWIGVQDGNDAKNFTRIVPDQDICQLSPTARSFTPPEPDLFRPSTPTEVLHFEADVVPVTKFWKEGGKIVTTKATSWYADIEEVMKQSARFSLIRSFYSYLIESLTNASWDEWRKIVPDQDQKELLNNMGFVYDELKAEAIMNHPRSPELVQDFGKMYVVALSRVRTFPPTTFYWQYLNKWIGGFVTPRKFREWGVVGDEWATKNVMLVNWDMDAPGGGLAKRICVGHVGAKFFEKAEPVRRYIRLC